LAPSNPESLALRRGDQIRSIGRLGRWVLGGPRWLDVKHNNSTDDEIGECVEMNRAVAGVAADKIPGSIRPLARRWVVEWVEPGDPFEEASSTGRSADLPDDRTARLPHEVQLTKLDYSICGVDQRPLTGPKVRPAICSAMSGSARCPRLLQRATLRTSPAMAAGIEKRLWSMRTWLR
jgi:hypothetical protein